MMTAEPRVGGSDMVHHQDGRRVPAVRVEGLSKTYGSGSHLVHAIGDLTFDVCAGEFVCIVGPSGAGKTTLLKCLAGLLPSSGGRLELDGRPVAGPPEKMALVFQDYGRSLLPWLTVLRNVTLPLRGKGISKAEILSRSKTMLDAVGVASAAHRYPWQLSGGMQQRVAIARALAYRPDVLLMDEPFASVDAQTRMDLEDLVLRLRSEFDITVVFVTHDIDEAVYLGDRVIVLTPSPTRVARVIDVALSGPRDQVETKADARFGEIRRELISLMQRSGPFGPLGDASARSGEPG